MQSNDCNAFLSSWGCFPAELPLFCSKHELFNWISTVWQFVPEEMNNRWSIAEVSLLVLLVVGFCFVRVMVSFNYRILSAIVTSDTFSSSHYSFSPLHPLCFLRPSTTWGWILWCLLSGIIYYYHINTQKELFKRSFTAKLSGVCTSRHPFSLVSVITSVP